MEDEIVVHNQLYSFVNLFHGHRRAIEKEQLRFSKNSLPEAISNEQLLEIFLSSGGESATKFGYIAPLDGVDGKELGTRRRVISQDEFSDLLKSLRASGRDNLIAKIEKRKHLPWIDIQHSAAVLTTNHERFKSEKRDRYFQDYDIGIKNRFLYRVKPAHYLVNWTKLEISVSDFRASISEETS